MQPRISAPSYLNRRQAIGLSAASLAALLLRPRAFADSAFVYGKNIEGQDVNTLATTPAKYIAAVFVATDCPISNRYLPLLARLAKQFPPRSARLWLIYPNPDDTLDKVRKHETQYPAASSLPQLIAPDPSFLAHAHVHVTPEAAIFRAGAAMSQPVLWHGRIDDRYLTFGTQRPAPTRHDLADALNAALAGRPPAPPAAPPVGCAIIPRA